MQTLTRIFIMSIDTSFSRIPIGFAFNRELYDTIPRSTKIKEDVLLSFVALKEIKSKSLEHAVYELENIVKVYNHNMDHINLTIKNRTSFEERTYDQFCREHGGLRKPSPSEYTQEEAKRQHAVLKRMDEEGQISQLADVFPSLAEKISRAAERLKTMSPNALPEFTLTPLDNKVVHNLFPPKLRIIADPIKTTVQAPIGATPTETPQVPPVIEKSASTAPKIAVTALCTLSSEQTLAICCAPEWAAKPIAFTKTENGWTGEIPVDIEWKFVIMQDAQVTHWEQANNNRCCDAQTQAFTVPAHEIKF